MYSIMHAAQPVSFACMIATPLLSSRLDNCQEGFDSRWKEVQHVVSVWISQRRAYWAAWAQWYPKVPIISCIWRMFFLHSFSVTCGPCISDKTRTDMEVKKAASGRGEGLANMSNRVTGNHSPTLGPHSLWTPSLDSFYHDDIFLTPSNQNITYGVRATFQIQPHSRLQCRTVKEAVFPHHAKNQLP